LISLVNWKYPGNPYFGNRALKMRAFVRCAGHLMMLDDHLDNHPDQGGARSDWMGSHLILVGFPYLGFKDALPEHARKAYEAGIRRMGERVLQWGPEGEEPNLEAATVAGLWHVASALGDAEFSRRVEAYAKRHFTDSASFHPAGFFVDHGGIDVGYQGTCNFLSIWTALASDWPFAKDAVDKAYRLRAHLLLPEPDGKWIGPSHFNSRTSNDASGDQWEWGIARDQAGSLVTSEAVHLVKLPDAATLAVAGARRASEFNGQIRENAVRAGGGGFIRNDEIRNNPWTWRLWQSFHFPASVNPGYEFYPVGAYAKHRKLVDEKSPLLLSPYLRGESFVRNFADAFTCVRKPAYAAIIHTGPVGDQHPDSGLHQFAGPLGFGGGQLSTFWTPAGGSFILGRRGGNTWDKTFDLVDNWRNWPIHAVSGVLTNGRVFTTARIRRPDVTSDGNGTVVVSGSLPTASLGQGKVLEGRLEFSRTFRIRDTEVEVESVLRAGGQDVAAELYETIPVYLHDARSQAKVEPTEIRFLVNGQWIPATTEPTRAGAVRLSRFQGHVVITFDRERFVKLSPQVWADTYLSSAKCRNLLIHLVDPQPTPTVLRGELKLTYRITP